MRLFVSQSYFGNDGSQNFLIFRPIIKTFTRFAGLPDPISKLESKGLLNERIKPPYVSNNSLSPKLKWMNNSKIRIRFNAA